LISLIEEAEVSAEEAGVLKDIPIKEGQDAAKGDLLAQIDDAKPKMELKVAEAKVAVAKEKVSDDINIRYAKTSALFAEADYLVNKEANDKVKGAVPDMVLRALRLKFEEASLGGDKAKLEMRIAEREMDAAKAEADAAAEMVRRHQVRSPQVGVIVKLYHHPGEWVQQGERVVHIIRIDRLWIEGFVAAADFHPDDLRGREAEVTVALAGGRQRTFSGKVVFVDSIVQAGGSFLVRVEVQNVQENGFWVLSPGLGAKMNIPLR
jgi:multidrug efflux pump subunit AcrA (membrane-fusion protein)